MCATHLHARSIHFHTESAKPRQKRVLRSRHVESTLLFE
jgi:hypothetical protein